ncbi:MAG: glycosyltransferase [Phycisphaera sp.]|nr:MAG: glycosyltransferase [Phycisphaera sp.]
MPDAPANPSVLIPMPQGMGVNGVVSWALRLAGTLTERGWPVGLVLHNEPEGHAPAGHQIPRGVRTFDLRHLPPMSPPGQPLAPFTRAYREALAELGWSPWNPAVMLPNLDAGTFAIAAALSATHGDYLRVVGWQHSDVPFDTALLTTYEPMLAAMVGVSAHITENLREGLPWRADGIHNIPCGVEVVEALPEREPGPIRLLYAGRLEHEQKRIGVLLELAEVLHERGVPHDLRFIGDGPAAREIEELARKLPSVRHVPPVNRSQMHEHLGWADAMLLSSRYEGLSLSMLEAMAAGVVPIVTRVRSGASEAVEHGVSGWLIDGEGEDPAVARRFADVIEQLAGDGLASMCSAAHARAAERYSLGTHADACAQLFRQAVAGEPRWWPLDRPCTFGGSGSGSPTASVPPDAAERAAKALATIEGPIAIYGAGRHTLAIAEVLANADVVCVIDDDPKNHGKTLWGWPVVGLEDCPRDVVVLVSSFMHRDGMARRCHGVGLKPLVLYQVARDSLLEGPQ